MQLSKRLLFNIIDKTVFFIGLVILWQLIYYIGIRIPGMWKPYNFPSPVSTFKTLVGLVEDNTLMIAVLSSLFRILKGYAISLLIGLVFGILIVKFKYLDRHLSPFILGLQTLPSICWLPFAILWFGLSESAIIFIVVIGSAFSITIAIEAGIKNINPLYIKAAKTMGAHGVSIYRHVIIPAALPGIITGMKQGWSFAWRALMAGEMLAATRGLGQVLMMGRELADINQVAAVMVIIALIGLIFDKAIFGKVESEIRYRWGLQRPIQN